MEENKKKIRQRGVNVYKNITKSKETLVKRLLILKNELIFDIPMLCLYALWFRSYFNDIEKKTCFKKFKSLIIIIVIII